MFIYTNKKKKLDCKKVYLVKSDSKIIPFNKNHFKSKVILYLIPYFTLNLISYVIYLILNLIP